MFPLLIDCQKAAETVVMQAMLSLMRYRKAHKFIPSWKKPDQTYVTPADYAIQYYFYQKLTSLFPHIPLVGEETLNPATDYDKIPQIIHFAKQLDPKVSSQDLYHALSPDNSRSSLFWLTDPIDGTTDSSNNVVLLLLFLCFMNTLLFFLSLPALHQKADLLKFIQQRKVKGS